MIPLLLAQMPDAARTARKMELVTDPSAQAVLRARSVAAALGRLGRHGT